MLELLTKSRRLILVGWWLSIAADLYFSLKPHVALPDITGADKFFHVMAYVELAFLPALIFPKERMPRIAACLVALGVAIEFIQPLNGRTSELTDMAANSTGVGLGWLIGWLALRVMSRTGLLSSKSGQCA